MQTRLKRYIGTRIRTRRRARGETQEHLAGRIGRTVESVSNIERARTLPNLETLVAISEALEVPLRDLFPSTGDGHVPSERRQRLESEMLELVSSLSDERLDIAVRQISALKT